MFEKFLESFLNKYFGKYFVNLDKKAMSLSVWKGEIRINRVELNPVILNDIKLPLGLRLGVIESLVIKIP